MNKEPIKNKIYTFNQLAELGFIDLNRKEFGYNIYKRGNERLGVKKLNENEGLIYLKYNVC